MISDCSTCESCFEILDKLNGKIANIGDTKLYNIRYEMNRDIDYKKFALLSFYKEVLYNICNDSDCDCYGYDTEDILERIKILLA